MSVKLLADSSSFIGNRLRLSGSLAGDRSHGEMSSSSGHDKPLTDVCVDLEIALSLLAAPCLDLIFLRCLSFSRLVGLGELTPAGEQTQISISRRWIDW